jgi:hypothetical protein
MSVLVIGNGYRYTGENLLDLLAHIGAFKLKAEDVALFAASDYIAARACELIDLEAVGMRRLKPHIEHWESPLAAVRMEAEKSRL